MRKRRWRRSRGHPGREFPKHEVHSRKPWVMGVFVAWSDHIYLHLLNASTTMYFEISQWSIGFFPFQDGFSLLYIYIYVRICPEHPMSFMIDHVCAYCRAKPNLFTWIGFSNGLPRGSGVSTTTRCRHAMEKRWQVQNGVSSQWCSTVLEDLPTKNGSFLGSMKVNIPWSILGHGISGESWK